ncbi:MAG: hypothetical protein ABR530_03490 [Pyrinomonadaceae bacterium]
MTIIDLIIVYLAAGAPFGVFQMTRNEPSSTLGQAPAALFSLALWPICLIFFGKKLLSSSFFATTQCISDCGASLRHEIERVTTAGSSTRLLFEFREIFYRYAGLLDAADQHSDGTVHEVFTVTKHPHGRLAARCLERRQRAHLHKHLLQARREFERVFATLLDSGETDRQEFEKLRRRLCEHDPVLNIIDLQPSPRPADTPVPQRLHARAAAGPSAY